MIYVIYAWNDYAEPCGFTYSKQQAIRWVQQQKEPSHYFICLHKINKKSITWLDEDFGQNIRFNLTK